MATITQSTIQELDQYFDDVRTDYSGRGMFGKECLAVVTDESAWTLRGEIQEILDGLDPTDATNDDLQDGLEALLDREPRQDSMGLSTVYYWPNVQVED